MYFCVTFFLSTSGEAMAAWQVGNWFSESHHFYNLERRKIACVLYHRYDSPYCVQHICAHTHPHCVTYWWCVRELMSEARALAWPAWTFVKTVY